MKANTPTGSTQGPSSTPPTSPPSSPPSLRRSLLDQPLDRREIDGAVVSAPRSPDVSENPVLTEDTTTPDVTPHRQLQLPEGAMYFPHRHATAEKISGVASLKTIALEAVHQQAQEKIDFLLNYIRDPDDAVVESIPDCISALANMLYQMSASDPGIDIDAVVREMCLKHLEALMPSQQKELSKNAKSIHFPNAPEPDPANPTAEASGDEPLSIRESEIDAIQYQFLQSIRIAAVCGSLVTRLLSIEVSSLNKPELCQLHRAVNADEIAKHVMALNQEETLDIYVQVLLVIQEIHERVANECGMCLREYTDFLHDFPKPALRSGQEKSDYERLRNDLRNLINRAFAYNAAYYGDDAPQLVSLNEALLQILVEIYGHEDRSDLRRDLSMRGILHVIHLLPDLYATLGADQNLGNQSELVAEERQRLLGTIDFRCTLTSDFLRKDEIKPLLKNIAGLTESHDLKILDAAWISLCNRLESVVSQFTIWDIQDVCGCWRFTNRESTMQPLDGFIQELDRFAQSIPTRKNKLADIVARFLSEHTMAYLETLEIQSERELEVLQRIQVAEHFAYSHPTVVDHILSLSRALSELNKPETLKADMNQWKAIMTHYTILEKVISGLEFPISSYPTQKFLQLKRETIKLFGWFQDFYIAGFDPKDFSDSILDLVKLNTFLQKLGFECQFPLRIDSARQIIDREKGK